MQKITDLLEKLDINKVNLSNKFPIDGTLKDIIEFLEEKDFQLTEYGYVKTIFNEAKAKCFMKDTTSIRFADTSRRDVSKDNPIFYIHLGNRKEYSVFYCGSDNDGLIVDIVENDKKEFLKELNKRFDW